MLAADTQDVTAGDDRLESRASTEEVRDPRRGLDDLLDVVKYQEQALLSQDGRELLVQRPIVELGQIQRLSDRRQNELGIADRGQRDEDHAIAEIVAQVGRNLEDKAGLAD